MKRHYFPVSLCSGILASVLIGGLAAQAASTNAFKEVKKQDLTLEGKITAIDTGAGTVTVQHKQKGSLTFSVPGSALLFVNHKKGHAALTDFKVGETVNVSYRQTGGTMVCDSMWQPGSNPAEKERKVEKKSGQ